MALILRNANINRMFSAEHVQLGRFFTNSICGFQWCFSASSTSRYSGMIPCRQAVSSGGEIYICYDGHDTESDRPAGGKYLSVLFTLTSYGFFQAAISLGFSENKPLKNKTHNTIALDNSSFCKFHHLFLSDFPVCFVFPNILF